MEVMGADGATAKKILQEVSQILVTDEIIGFIAVQQRKFAGLIPDAAVMTNRRCIIYRPSLFKTKFEDGLWRDIQETALDESILAARLIFTFVDGRQVIIDDLPKDAARRAYAYAEEKEQEAAEIRRQRQMEEDRAKVGGVFVGQSIPPQPGMPAADGSMAKLTQLKSLLDAHLITQEEYDKKKAQILSEM